VRSAVKARRERLLKLSEAQLDWLCAPIGLPIGARTPEEVAVAILAQISATTSFIDGRAG